MRVLKKLCVLVMVMMWVAGIAGCAWGGVSLSAFPDPVFREYLRGYDRGWLEYDSNGEPYTVGQDDGFLDDREIKEITDMNFSYGGSTITSLKGIEYFTALKKLHCSSCHLTELDVSKNTALTVLECSGKWYSGGAAGDNCLTILNVSGCTALTSLNCQGNQLTDLDVSSCISLTNLCCRYNKLTRLDVSKNTALEVLYCDANDLTNLDVSNHTALRRLGFGGKISDNGLFTMDSLITLDVSNCTALVEVNSSGGDWQIHIPSLKKLDASNCTSLTHLNCAIDYFGVNPQSNGQLATLDLSGCTALTHLWCYNNSITQLDLSRCTALTWLHCYDNQLATLNVSQFKALRSLICSNNQLTMLDVSRNTLLTGLNFSSNKITEIDVSNNTALDGFICSDNQLKELDVSNNTGLTQFECNDNQLTELDLSHTAVEYQYVSYERYLSQQRRGLKVNKTSEGYEVDMKDYVSHLENIDADTIKEGLYGIWNPISYSKETGIAVFKEPITSLSYKYNTQRNDMLMPVIITNPLSITALERYGSEIDGLIIHNMTDNSYLNWNGEPLTESAIYYYRYSDYGKLGLAADGNSRLIIRAQTDKPGTVSFSFNEDIGAKLESLSRKELSASDQLSTTDMGSDIHQVSAVLVAPERFPESKLLDFPYSTFKIHVKFTDEDGETTEDDLELKLEAAPVVLIHGLRDEGANCFGVGKDSGIWHVLRQNKFRDVRIWNYDGSRGPEDLLSGVGFANPLFRTLGEVFDKYLNRGIVCTRADLVCHSMGGLMARKFLEETGKELPNGNNWSERSYKQGMVRRVITIATPHRGSPWADIVIERSTNPIGKILHGLLQMNISAGKYFDKNSDSAFRDLMTTAPRAYDFPSNVPMYSIHGDVKDNVKAFSQYIGNAGTWIGKLAGFTAPHVAVIMRVVGAGMELSAGLADVINDDVFKGEGHDMIVSVPSAAGDFAGSESGHKGWGYMHINICHQDSIGIEVVNLLTGPVDVFKKFGVSAKTAVNKSSPSLKKMASDSDSEQIKFIEALNLKIEPSVFTVSDNTSQTVKFSVTASNPTTYDIYCAIEAGNSYRLFKFPDANDGKTFSAQLVFASQDSGVMNAFCFSHNPHDSEGKSLHVSNIAKILTLSDISGVNIVSLDFAGKTTAYTNVNSETPAGLFAVDSDGRYYNVSSPLAGTQWTSTEFAQVNENGCICGLKEGSTTLTANFMGLTASVNVEVSAALVEEEDDTPPEVITATLPNAITGKSYTATLTASGATPITWTRKSGNLPKGLTFSESGIISGTPTKAGKSTFTVTATNAHGSDTRKFTLQVCDPVSITTASLKAATIAKSYSFTFKAKGMKPLTWSATGLPYGLTLNANTGKISGKPSAHGTFSVKITATNPAETITKELLLTVKGIPPKLSGTLTKAELGKIYSSGLKLTAGSLPVTWSMTGILPDGLTFDANTGTISGTPTSYAKSGYKLTITAKNDVGEKSKNVTLTVKATAPKITTKKLPDATAGSPYTATLTATGSEPITWTADGLPDGLYVDGSTITGIPTQSGKFTVTLHAENPVKSASRPITLKVNPAQNESLPAIHETSGEAYSALPSEHSEETTQTHSGGYIIVAELGEISCDMAGMYEFDVVLNDNASEGAELVYMAGSDNPSDDDDIAEFFDSEGNPVTTVPENREITLSIWLNPQIIYRPAIAIK